MNFQVYDFPHHFMFLQLFIKKLKKHLYKIDFDFINMYDLYYVILKPLFKKLLNYNIYYCFLAYLILVINKFLFYFKFILYF